MKSRMGKGRVGRRQGEREGRREEDEDKTHTSHLMLLANRMFYSSHRNLDDL